MAVCSHRLTHCMVAILLAVPFQLHADHHLIALALDIAPDDIQTGTLAEGDNFYYLVSIPESGVLRTYTQGTLDTYGELMFTNETEIAVADGGGEDDNFLIEAMLEPGDYLIRVAGATPFETGPFNIVTEFTGDSEPAQPGGPIPVSEKIRSLTGGSTDAGIAAGAFANDGSPAYSNSFTTADDITILAEIRPDTADVDVNGILLVIWLSITGNGIEWFYLDQDGEFIPWDLDFTTLQPADVRQPLAATNAITIFEGNLAAGRHRMAIGYQATGGPLIYTAKAINITVSN